MLWKGYTITAILDALPWSAENHVRANETAVYQLPEMIDAL